MIKRFPSLFMPGVLVIFLGCAHEVTRIPTSMVQISSGETVQSIYLIQDVNVILDTGYERVLKSGTRWDCTGKISEGYVYKPVYQILTIEGANVHEAYIVVSDGLLSGFYLPVEKAFSPTSTKLKIP